MNIFHVFMKYLREVAEIADSPFPTEPEVQQRPPVTPMPEPELPKEPESDPRDEMIESLKRTSEWLSKELQSARQYGDRASSSLVEYCKQNQACWEENQRIKTKIRAEIGYLRNELDPEL